MKKSTLIFGQADQLVYVIDKVFDFIYNGNSN